MKDKAPAKHVQFSIEICAEICALLADGYSLRSVCERDGFPSKSTVFRWLAEKETFRDQYARAMEARADAHFEEMFEIADDASNDWMERKNQDEQSIGWQLNGEHVQRSRLRIDTRKWAIARMNAKKYGDKLDLNHGGNVGLNITKIENVVVDPANSEQEND